MFQSVQDGASRTQPTANQISTASCPPNPVPYNAMIQGAVRQMQPATTAEASVCTLRFARASWSNCFRAPAPYKCDWNARTTELKTLGTSTANARHCVAAFSTPISAYP